MTEGCIFCEIVQRKAPARFVREWYDAIAIVPLNPVMDGHVLVIPRVHVEDATTDPYFSAKAMWYAASIAPNPSNIITSVGADATQTIFHLHLHVVPRTKGDGLLLPWSLDK